MSESYFVYFSYKLKNFIVSYLLAAFPFACFVTGCSYLTLSGQAALQLFNFYQVRQPCSYLTLSGQAALQLFNFIRSGSLAVISIY